MNPRLRNRLIVAVYACMWLLTVPAWAQNARIAENSPDSQLGEAKSMVREAAIEKVIAGIDSPKPADAKQLDEWRSRMNEYLRLSNQLSDPRLAQPLIRLYERDPFLAPYEIFSQLSKIDHPSVVDFCLAHPGLSGATDLARQRLGNELPARLLALARSADTPKEKAAIAALFTTYSRSPVSPQMRKAAVAALTPMLADKSGDTAEAAVLALGNFLRDEQGHTDAVTLAAVLAWVKSTDELPVGMEGVFSSVQHPDIGAVFHEWLRAHPDGNNQWVISLLGRQKYEPAIPDLIARYEKRPRARSISIAALGALSEIGGDGSKYVHQVLQTSPSFGERYHAAQALGSASYQPAAQDVLTLCEFARRQGGWRPDLITDGEQAFVTDGRTVVERLAAALVKMDASASLPYVERIAIDVVDRAAGDRLQYQIQQAMARDRTLKEVAAAPPLPRYEPRVAEKDLPLVPELDILTWWRELTDKSREGGLRSSAAEAYAAPPSKRATRFGQAPAAAPPDPAEKLLGAGVPAIDAMIELCYPDAPLQEKGIETAVHALGNPATRGHAIAVLAAGFYRADVFEKVLTQTQGEPLAIGEAIRRWRGDDPWTIRKKRELFTAAHDLLETRWPMAQLQAFARSNMDRLALVENTIQLPVMHPMAPILASLRYSTERSDREALVQFITQAGAAGAETGLAVIDQGLAGRTRSNMPAHWKNLPPQTLEIDYAAMLDPSRPRILKMAMYRMPTFTPEVRSQLKAVVASPATDPDLRREVRRHLWYRSNGRDAEYEKYFIEALNSKDESEFRAAAAALGWTDAGVNPIVYMTHFKRVLADASPARRQFVIRLLSDAGFRRPQDMPEVAQVVAPFLESQIESDRRAAISAMRSIEMRTKEGVLAPLIADPATPPGVRTQAILIREECDRSKNESEKRNREHQQRFGRRIAPATRPS